MASRAIRVIVNTEDGKEYALGLGLDDFPEEEHRKLLEKLFNTAVGTASLNYRVHVNENTLEAELMYHGL